MPELPEVQTTVDDLKRAGVAARQITAARVFWPSSVSPLDAEVFCRDVTGETIASVQRRGKFIVLGLFSGKSLLIHLRMTGKLSLKQPGTVRSKHEHVILMLDDDLELRFHDTRKFGRFYYLEDAETVLGRLGPEPLGARFTAKTLAAMLSRRRRQIKPLLLDQHFIAGLGNIYTDEALWLAGIHPCRPAGTLSREETGRLHRAIRKVLRQGLKNMGTSLGTSEANFYSVAGRRGRNRDQLQVFRRTGLPCRRCGESIIRLQVAQRGTHICPSCQK
jgi:formamidopyrimidine-DNA glycosylase